MLSIQSEYIVILTALYIHSCSKGLFKTVLPVDLYKNVKVTSSEGCDHGTHFDKVAFELTWGPNKIDNAFNITVFFLTN